MSEKRSLRRYLISASCVALVGVLGVVDHLTGPEVSFSIFYLLPISVATLFAGRTDALIVGMGSAVTWFIADMTAGHTYSHWLIPYWNATVRLGYFSLHAILLSSLKDRIHHEIERGRRSGRPITIAVFDLDNFKTVNDTLGHDAGDEVLRTVVRLIRQEIRPADLLARTGGDEFALLLPETAYGGARTVLHRIRDRLASEVGGRGWPVTVSTGAITFKHPPPSVDALVKRADELMYAARQAGKNNFRHDEWPSAPTGP